MTSVARTLADLAGLRVDFGHLAQVVKDALSKGAIDFQTLASRLNAYARAYKYSSGDEFTTVVGDGSGVNFQNALSQGAGE